VSFDPSSLELIKLGNDRVDVGVGVAAYRSLGTEPDIPLRGSARTVLGIEAVVAMHRKASCGHLPRDVVNSGFRHVKDDLHAAVGRIGTVWHGAHDNPDRTVSRPGRESLGSDAAFRR